MAIWGRTPGGAFGVLAVSAVVFAGLAAPAGASHIPGATYTGTSTTGPSVTFKVSANGAGIDEATLTDSGNQCSGFNSSTRFYANGGMPLPISNHSFSDPDFSFVFDIAWQGSFSGPQSASGTITSPQCTPQTLSWSATTSSPPPPACSDLSDNDGDGKVDYPADPGCTGPSDNDETDPPPPPGAGGGGTSERCVVPNVKRKRVPAAKRAIVNADCRVGTIGRAFSARVARGRIISQRPRAGAQRPEGAKVNFVVSKGPRRR